ncbi:MAG: hypothetical protein WC444_03860 [Candidatus Paceibacterota bacterium]
MPKLSHLLTDERFSSAQREHVRTRVAANISRGEDAKSSAQVCLQELWQSYDYDGISMGRSLRACILEELLQLLDGCFDDEARQLLAFLVAMYHDVDYLNSVGWYDYVVTIEALPLGYRILLLSAAVALDIEELPEIDEESNSIVRQLVLEGKEKRRLVRAPYVWV